MGKLTERTKLYNGIKKTVKKITQLHLHNLYRYHGTIYARITTNKYFRRRCMRWSRQSFIIFCFFTVAFYCQYVIIRKKYSRCDTLLFALYDNYVWFLDVLLLTKQYGCFKNACWNSYILGGLRNYNDYYRRFLCSSKAHTKARAKIWKAIFTQKIIRKFLILSPFIRLWKSYINGDFYVKDSLYIPCFITVFMRV